MMFRYIYLSLILAILVGCKQSDNSLLEKDEDTKVINEVLSPKNGVKKLGAITEGAIMPHGTLKTIDNSDVSSSSFAGQALVLNYWATWCKPCMTDTPKFQETAAEFPNAKFVSISIDREFDTWKSFIQDENWSGNQYWLGMDETSPLYSFTYSNLNTDDIKGVHVTLPKYIIIGADGTIHKKSIPSPGTPNFKEELTKYLQ